MRGLPVCWDDSLLVGWFFITFFKLLSGLITDGFLTRVVVSVEKLLEFCFPQQKWILFDEFCLFLILDGYLFILIKVILLHHGDERWFDLFWTKFLPVYPTEPRVALQFWNTGVSEPILRFSSDQLIHKISWFITPGVRDLAFLQLHVFGQHQVPNFIPWTSIVRSFAGH